MEVSYRDVPQELLLGATGHIVPRATTVLTGICLGKNKAEKERWLTSGPSLEAIFSIELAARIAKSSAAQLHVWLPAAEYANCAASMSELDPMLEFKVAEVFERCIAYRFPDSVIHNTARTATRSALYGEMARHQFASFFPKGIRCPYGASAPTLWEQLGFVATIAMMTVVTNVGAPTIAVFDHDQIRPTLCACSLAKDKLGGIFFWPPPSMNWRPGSNTDPHSSLTRIQRIPRRMFRCEDASCKVYLGDTEASLRERIPSSSSLSTLWELEGYAALCSSLSIGDAAGDNVHLNLERHLTGMRRAWGWP